MSTLAGSWHKRTRRSETPRCQRGFQRTDSNPVVSLSSACGHKRRGQRAIPTATCFTEPEDPRQPRSPRLALQSTPPAAHRGGRTFQGAVSRKRGGGVRGGVSRARPQTCVRTGERGWRERAHKPAATRLRARRAQDLLLQDRDVCPLGADDAQERAIINSRP